MSYTFQQSYSGYLPYAGTSVEMRDSDDNVLGSGTIHSSGCGGIEVEVPDNFAGLIYLVRTSDDLRLGSDVFDYRNIPIVPAGSGPYTVTVDAGLPGVAVSLKQGIDVVQGITGAGGTVELHPADLGDYALLATKAGYSPVSRTETVTDGMTITVALEQVVITPPSDPSLCLVYGYFKKPDQTPWAGLEIKLNLQAPVPISGGAVIASRVVELVADSEGRINLDPDAEPVLVDRTDAMTPPGYKWLVTSEKAKISSLVSLEAETFDLGTLVEG